ncbi:hypothetical protein I4U23_019015 [Adineta vaga]|nr:hypothetical protein I4U23_019015 [Adineta vaga]
MQEETDCFVRKTMLYRLIILFKIRVIFMIFGPMMRSEAWKRVDNYIFGQEMGDEDYDGGSADVADA